MNGLSPSPAHNVDGRVRPHPRLAGWMWWSIAVTLAFALRLADLVVYSSRSELYSYIPLVPCVAGYLLYVRRHTLPREYGASWVGVGVFLGIAAASLTAAWAWRAGLSTNDRFALEILAYVSLVVAGGFLFLGARWIAAAAFPVAFLFFLVPVPDAVVRVIEDASVLASADMSALLFRMTGTPMVRDGGLIAIPGIVLEVARECSGINSTWVLFIVGLVASNLFLKATWARVAVVVFIVPLAIVRNSLRILTIGLLCAHIGPHMIDSYIHRRGGPFFFALSLLPLFAVIVWLRRVRR